MSEELAKFMREVHEISKEKGWHDSPSKTDLECLMLMVAEVSEAAEEIREGKPNYYEVNGKPEGQSVELADVILRIFDYAESRKLPLIEALYKKHEYNKTRPYKHGKLI